MSLKWKLEQNIKALSVSQDTPDCFKEWRVVSSITPLNLLGVRRCLCSNINLKRGFRVYNSKTGEFAVLGSACVKKIGIKKGKIKKNSILSLIMKSAIYTEGLDPKEASIVIKQIIFDGFECEIENADELYRLNVILVEIEWDIENYQFSFLKSLQERLIAKINDIQTMLDERERQRILEQERQNTIQAERERREVEELMREDPSLPRKDAEDIVFLRTITF